MSSRAFSRIGPPHAGESSSKSLVDYYFFFLLCQFVFVQFDLIIDDSIDPLPKR